MKRWAIATVLALIGLAAMGPLVAMFDISNMWRLRLTREAAISEARRLAREHGVNADDWSALCRANISTMRAYLERFQGRPAHPLFTAAQYEVSLLHPGGRRAVKITLGSGGRPVSFLQSFAPGERPVASQVRPDRLLALYAGEFERSFERENEQVEQGQSLVDSWAWGSVNEFEASARFEVVQENGTLRSAKLEPRLPAGFIDRFRKDSTRQQSIQGSVGTVIITILFAVAFPLFFRGLVRRRFSTRLLLPVGLFFLVQLAIGGFYAFSMGGAFTARETFSSPWTVLPSNLFVWALVAASLTLCYSAGRTLLSDADLERWFSFESLLRGQVLTRPVGTALAGGAL